MGMKEIIEKWRGKGQEKSKKFVELEDDFRMQKKLEEKQKSANERELDSFMKEEREEKIKQQLDAYRKRRKDLLWHGNNILGGHKEFNILKNERPILKEKDVIGLFGGTGKNKKEKSLYFH